MAEAHQASTQRAGKAARGAGRKLTRAESKERTRRDVLRAAARLFLRDGFVDTSLAAIAEEAGVTKGAVYANFDSKEDLFLSIVREQQVRGVDANPMAVHDWSPLDNGHDPAAGFAQVGRDVHRRLPSRAQVALFLEYNAFALRSARSRRSVAEHNGAYFEAMGEQLAALLGDSLDDDDGADLAAIAQSLFVGLALHQAVDPDRFDAELFAAAFARLAAR